MVDVNRIESKDQNPVFKVTDDTKSKSTYTVHKTQDGFAFFEVLIDKGSVPAVLSGRFTTPDKAIKAVEDYLRKRAPSQTVKRDANTRAREKQKNAKAAVSTDSKEHLRKGTAD